MTLIKWNGLNKGQFGYSWPHSVFDDIFTENFGGKASFVPAVNVSEKDSNFSIEVSAPGFKKEDFKVEAEEGVLKISGEHKEENKEGDKKFTRREFRYGSFSRSFTLPDTAKVEDIKARYENGILEIEIPKKQEEPKAQAKEIKIS
jgi:HSP20 family protein